MINLLDCQFAINFKEIPESEEWLVTIRDSQDKTVATSLHSGKKQGEKWARNVVNSLTKYINSRI
ncbi:MAG: hypothetical protein ACFB02_21915 [Mastigocoleus sp.]